VSEKSDKILIEYYYESGDEGGPSFDTYYKILDLKTKEFTNFDFIRDKGFKEIAFDYVIPDVTGNYFLCHYHETDRFANTIISKGFIFDKNFEYVGDCLPNNIKGHIKGFNFKDGYIYSYNIGTYNDNSFHDYERIITYRMNFTTEQSLYDIYNDIPLTKSRLDSCDYYELEKLQKMVYAKHNYKFEDEYYQAFFNLYDFYNSNDMKKFRLENVEDLFTETDKKNLKLIEKYIKNYNK
jgi:hypothetical protein